MGYSDNYLPIIPLGEDGELYMAQGHIELGDVYLMLQEMVDFFGEDVGDLNNNWEWPRHVWMTITEQEDEYGYIEVVYQPAKAGDERAEPFTMVAMKGSALFPPGEDGGDEDNE